VARLNAEVPLREFHDFEPRTGEDLRSFDEVFARRGHVLGRHVVEEAETGLVVAYAHYFHMPWAHSPTRFWCAVRCAPAFRRRGAGGRLYAEVGRDLERLGAREVRAMVREAAPELVARMAELGYEELFRSWDFELDLGRWQGALLPGEPRFPFVITPLPEEQARCPGWLARLRELYIDVNREVPLPNSPDPEPPPEVLSDYLDRWPTSLPDACFVAREGDRYVGVCILHRSEDDPSCLSHLFTGVDRAYRGRGVANALKLATIDYGRRRGYARILTVVESNNPGMMALNEKLGFVRRGGRVVFSRQLPRGFADAVGFADQESDSAPGEGEL
jgi:mycothiol synthase